MTVTHYYDFKWKEVFVWFVYLEAVRQFTHSIYFIFLCVRSVFSHCVHIYFYLASFSLSGPSYRMTWMTQSVVWYLSAQPPTRPSPCSSSWPRLSRATSSRLLWKQMRKWWAKLNEGSNQFYKGTFILVKSIFMKVPHTWNVTRL